MAGLFFSLLSAERERGKRTRGQLWVNNCEAFWKILSSCGHGNGLKLKTGFDSLHLLDSVLSQFS